MQGLATDIERIVKEGIVFKGDDGKVYSPANLKKVCDDREPEAITLQTLTGLQGYLEKNIDGLDKKSLLIVVDSYAAVRLFQQINDATKNRFNFVNVNLEESGRKFPFGSFLDSEEFTIRIQSMFKSNLELTQLLGFISRLTINNSIHTQDDGVSQVVTVKSGISGALKENEKAPSIIELIPNRTFPEVEQPESKFLFRLRTVEGKIPTCALFEADGGEWRNQAMKNIKTWCEENVDGVSVIA